MLINWSHEVSHKYSDIRICIIDVACRFVFRQVHLEEPVQILLISNKIIVLIFRYSTQTDVVDRKS